MFVDVVKNAARMPASRVVLISFLLSSQYCAGISFDKVSASCRVSNTAYIPTFSLSLDKLCRICKFSDLSGQPVVLVGLASPTILLTTIVQKWE